MTDHAIAEHGVGYAYESPPEEEQQCLKNQKLEEEEDNQQLLEVGKHKQKELSDSEFSDDEMTEEERRWYIKQIEGNMGIVVDPLPNKKKKKNVPDDDLTEEEWNRYGKQVKESGGFDVENFPNKLPPGLIVSVLGFDKDYALLKKVNCCANLAINSYNAEYGTKYELSKVVKLNAQVVAGAMFYITFEAYDGAADGGHSLECFQALVHRGIVENEVNFCRLKPKLGVAQSPGACGC